MEKPPPSGSFNDFGYRKKKAPRPDAEGSSSGFRKPYGANKSFGPRKPYGPRRDEAPRDGDGARDGERGGYRKPYAPRKPYGARAEGEGGGFRKSHGPRKPGFSKTSGKPFASREPSHRESKAPKRPYGDGKRPVWRKTDSAGDRPSDGEKRRDQD